MEIKDEHIIWHSSFHLIRCVVCGYVCMRVRVKAQERRTGGRGRGQRRRKDVGK